MPVVLPQEYQAVVVAKTQLTPTVIGLRLTPTLPIPFQAGQYASWLIDTHRRPLSFATPPGQTEVEFVVGTAAGGVASQYVTTLTVNDTVRMLAPYGRFTLTAAHDRPLLFIATGTGIAPIRAQLYAELNSSRERPVTLLFGNMNEEYQFFDEEFSAVAAAYPRVTYIPVLAAPAETGSSERGLVTEVTPRLVPDIAATEAYVCGSPAMVRDTIAMLLKNGLPKEHVHTEQYT